MAFPVEEDLLAEEVAQGVFNKNILLKKQNENKKLDLYLKNDANLIFLS